MGDAASEIASKLAAQRAHLESGATRPVEARIALLKTLRKSIKEHEDEILEALRRDLGKAPFEGYGAEVGFVYEELRYALDNVRSWARPVRVKTPLVLQPATSYIVPEPKGVVLIIGPWNYPFQLVIAPLIAALAAGNCVILKPSELAPATEAVLEKLIGKTFDPKVVALQKGGVAETTELLRQKFDHIFFTGSIPVGRIVMEAAAKHLTPVTLELGGKSPCIVDKRCDVDVTARRIAWGKFYNAGQTCVAPDYLLVHEEAHDRLIDGIAKAVKEFFGEDPKASPDYPRIINRHHYQRLEKLLASGRAALGGGGDPDALYIAPTVLTDVTMDDPVMADEIFGPILPVLKWRDLDEALALVRQRPNPLACYVFTNDGQVERKVLETVRFGGGCVNNTLIHLANPELPFGGVGESGMGAYHGREGFDTFSHKKSITKSGWIDIKVKYPPYGNKLKLVRALMR